MRIRAYEKLLQLEIAGKQRAELCFLSSQISGMEELFSGHLPAYRGRAILSANKRHRTKNYNSKKLNNKRSVQLIGSLKLVYYRRSALRGRQLEMRAPRRELIRLVSDACVNRLARLNSNFKNVLRFLKGEVREL